jgi:hypothetical protein
MAVIQWRAPTLIVVILWRIFFIYGDGDEIKSQFFFALLDRVAKREKRAKNKITRMEWATQELEPWQ